MKKIFKTLSGLLFIYLFVISCSKDDSPKVSVAVGKIKTTSDSATINFNITRVFKQGIYDTVTLRMEGYSSDSLQRIVIQFNQVLGFAPQKYVCGTELATGTVITVNYYSKGERFVCDGVYGDGTINVLSYNTIGITGNFSLTAGKQYDTSKIVHLDGEFNAVFDVNSLIPDIDIQQGKMQAKVNNTLKIFDVISAVVSFNGVDSTINVTGTNGEESIILQFVNLYPSSGQVFHLDPGSDSNDEYIKGSYVLDSLNTFTTQLHDSAIYARFTVVKIAGKYIQGKFEFICRNTQNSNSLVKVTEGKFNSKINSSYEK
jgi:hypothetical protein